MVTRIGKKKVRCPASGYGPFLKRMALAGLVLIEENTGGDAVGVGVDVQRCRRADQIVGDIERPVGRLQDGSSAIAGRSLEAALRSIDRQTHRPGNTTVNIQGAARNDRRA